MIFFLNGFEWVCYGDDFFLNKFEWVCSGDDFFDWWPGFQIGGLGLLIGGLGGEVWWPLLAPTGLMVYVCVALLMV